MLIDQQSEMGDIPYRGSYTTIDDLIHLAEELVNGLNKLGEYKHPLSVRKGVINMIPERESVTIKATGRMYFLDVKETKEGKPYLVITESRSKGEGKERERRSIFIFQENAREFAQAVTKIADKIGS